MAQARPGQYLAGISSQFTVPKLNCRGTKGKTWHIRSRYDNVDNGVTIWAGLDGGAKGDYANVEQSGVWLWCDWHNGAHYQAFNEMAPANPHMPANVHPGDQIQTNDWQESSGQYALSVVDIEPNGKHDTWWMNATAYAPQDLTAEAIVERPVGDRYLTMYKGSVNFLVDAQVAPLASRTAALFAEDTPWTTAHKWTAKAYGQVLTAPGPVHDTGNGLSAFSETTRWTGK